MKKKILSIILALIITFNIPLSYVETVKADSSYIQIYTVEDLLNINSNLGGNYILMKDIDLSTISNWQTIGDDIIYLADKAQTGFTEDGGAYFTGTFDGNGHTISNLIINDKVNEHYDSKENSAYGFGLFGHVSGGTIKNLTIENINAKINTNSNEGAGTTRIIYGAICASTYNANIDNCIIESGKINISKESLSYYGSCSGGAVGIDLGKSNIELVTNNSEGDLDAGIISSGTYNYSDKTSMTLIRNCTNKGSINGAAGIISGGGVLLDSCTNYSDLSGGNVGGIILMTYGASDIVNCINYGKITSEAKNPFVGGIVGKYFNYRIEGCFISKCQNYGDIEVKSDDDEGYYVSAVGGIAGELDSSTGYTSILDCINYGDISVDFKNATAENKTINCGGIVGWGSVSGVDVKNLLNKGNIDVSNVNGWAYLSGIFGNVNDGNTRYYNIINDGNLNSNKNGYTFCAGITSQTDSATYNFIANKGNIRITNINTSIICGGLLGNIYGTTIENAYNIGKIEIYQTENSDRVISYGNMVANITGNTQSNTIANFYSKGTVNLDIGDYSKGTVNLGYIYGRNPKDGEILISNCYIDENITRYAYGDGDDSVKNNISYISDFSKQFSFAGFDFTNDWKMGNEYPVFKDELVPDTTKPTGSISATNNISSSQTVTLSLSDNVEVEGYYWGTNSSYLNNTYTTTSSSSATKTISSSGTYYLTVKDTSGNISDTVSVTFYKTTLNGNGGSVSPSSVITKSGNSFTLPTPTRSGYTFKGWFASSSATSGSVTNVMPSSNTTYYATWSQNDTTKPTGSIDSTNNVATSQTVTLNLSDNVGIAGYYWGTNSSYISNTYTTTSLSSVTKTISSNGTYYLTVKDTSGNVSDIVSVTFYKTTLNANGGSVSPSSVITKSGNSFTLPTPTRSGYVFNGWSLSSSATSGNTTNLNVTGNTTYYATWQVKNSEFKWGQDNWNFNNSSYQGYFTDDLYIDQIDDDYLDVLASNLTNSEYNTLFNTKNGWLYDEWGGSCYGMSSLCLLSKSGLFPYADYKYNSTNLNQLDCPYKDWDVSSLVTYYQMLQVKSVIQQKYRTVPYRTNKQNIEEIIDTLDDNETVLIGFKKNGWGGHAILAYDYEYGSYTWNGISYQGCIKICDPNSSRTENSRCNIYFNTNTYNWTIPYYSSVPITSTSGAVFNYVGSNINEINYGGYLSDYNSIVNSQYVARLDAVAVADERSIVKVDEKNGQYYTQSKASDDIVEDYSYIIGGESQGTVGYTLFDSESAYRLTQSNAQKLDLSIDYVNCNLTGMSQAGHSITFDKKGFVLIEGENADFDVSMTFNDGYPTDWFTIYVMGSNASIVSLTKGANGYYLEGDNLENIKIEANNREDIVEASFSTDYKKVYIYEIDKYTIGIKADTDDDGVYETVVKQTQKPTEETTKSEETTTEQEQTTKQVEVTTPEETTYEKPLIEETSKNNEIETTVKDEQTTRLENTIKGEQTPIVDEETSKSSAKVINNKASKVKKIKAKKKALKVTWKKVIGINGYQIQYSTSSKFKKAKTITIKKSKTTSKIIKKLKSKKKYYVRIRTYINVNGKKKYSSWSKKKSQKTK